MRIVRPILTVLALLALAYFGFRFLRPLFTPQEEEMDVQTSTVIRGDLRRVVPSDGVLKPAVQVEVKSKASGVVEAMLVEPGDDVAAGAILVELDKEQIQARLRQAEAAVMSAEAALVKTKRNLSPQQLASAESQVRNAEIAYERSLEHYNRIKELFEKGYATQEEMDSAQSELNLAEESLEQAKQQLELDLQGGEEEDIAVAEANVAIRQAELDDVREELANTTIRAPIAGRVLTRPVEIGTAVASGTSGNTGGTVVATIGDMSTLYIQARIDETDLGRVSLGMSCRVSFDAYPGLIWPGKLKKIYPQGETADSGTRFPVDVELAQQPIADTASNGFGNGGGNGQGRGRGMRGQLTWPSLALGSVAYAAQTPPPGGAPPADAPAPPGRAQERKSKRSDAGEDSPAPELKPNMTANVEFVIEDHPNVLIVEAKYIQYTEDRKPFCEVLLNPEDQTQREHRDIELGFSDGMRFEVLSGLNEGDTVIVERPIEEEPQRMFF